MKGEPQRARQGLLSLWVGGAAVRGSPSTPAPPRPAETPPPARQDPTQAQRQQRTLRPPGPRPRRQAKLAAPRVAVAPAAPPRECERGLAPACRLQAAARTLGLGQARLEAAGGRARDQPPAPSLSSLARLGCPRRAALGDPSSPDGTHALGRNPPHFPSWWRHLC